MLAHSFLALWRMLCGTKSLRRIFAMNARGIKKMFNEQWRRHFPMPDYEIDQIKKIASKQQPMSNFRCIQLRNIKQLPVEGRLN